MSAKRNITMADPFFSALDRKFIHQEVDNILSGMLSMGPHVKALEEEFASTFSVKHAIAMNSCTATLEAALLGAGLIRGQEVIVPTETFIATGMAVYLSGGTPVFSEISPGTLCLDIDDIERRITRKTKALIVVYMAGMIPENILEIRNICDKHNIFMIEDCAHAPGARRYGRFAGSFGHAGCFSLFPTKVVTAGEGGVLTTNDDKLAKIIRSLQHRGRNLDCNEEEYIRPGRNVRMTEMSALLARTQLCHLQEFLHKRRRIAKIYKMGLNMDKRVQVIAPEDDNASAYWKFPVILHSKINRKSIIDYMHGESVFVDTAYNPPLHLQPVFREIYKTKEGMLPISESILNQHLCLPCHPNLSDADANFVVETLRKAMDISGGACEN